ncbi:MAG: type II toxin-antitoxin system RelE/ParE family toxin [Thermoanaerobaculia bacterium]|nr:type II toxin-antitoxin system RelE/ParE family toxin [Thermoanaerobaculia bacterium]
MYQVSLARPAQRFYEDADAALQRRLDQAFAQLAAGPSTASNVKRLQPPLATYHRLRVGDYRIIFSVDHPQRLVVVASIEHRSRAYR